MQTFLPLPPTKLDEPIYVLGNTYIEWSYSNTFKLLDYRRLGKQRVETMQIYDAMVDGGVSRWRHHPIAKMWKPYPIALLTYGLECSQEWRSRGYVDNMTNEFMKRIEQAEWDYRLPIDDPIHDMPWWMGEEEFHQSHRSNLLRKLPEHYRQFWENEPDDLPYVWYA